MTSMEIGINRAVDRAFNQQTIASSREYRDQIKAELGPGADAYKVNREIQKKREDQARQAARAPFEAAQAAKNQQSEIIKYMQSVQDILNELKAYAHAT
jgi:copper oxidase (laccase) domain-containing protein